MTRVQVIDTGGTIGMVPSDPADPASPLRPGTRDDLRRSVPDLSGIGIEVVVDGLVDREGRPIPPADSSDVGPDHWRALAAQIGAGHEDCDGFVVLHGTDTMAYTASALSFMLPGLAKPVVLTGSQLPITADGSDAPGNLLAALRVAGWRATGLPLVPEVVICFADVILRGNRAQKVSARSWRAFDSPDLRPLGVIGERIAVDEDLVLPPGPDGGAVVARPELDDRVADLTIVPGIRAETFVPVLASPDIRGVVLRTFGAGNAPARPDLLDAIGAAVDAGTVVVSVTQCAQGSVEAGLYAASSGLLERGVVSGLDMTPEAALTKLMALLAREDDPAAVAAQMPVAQRGELTPDPG